MKKNIYTLLLVTGTTFISCNQEVKKEIAPKEYAIFDENNNLLRPKGYRTWVFAGANATPKSLDSTVLFPDFQNIYIDPISYEYWKEHGKWREGTIFVKELLRKGDTVSPVSTGGKAFYQGSHYSVSAMVKDSKRFPDMHNGWNYFKYVDARNFKLTEKSAPQGMKCASCHIPNAIDGDVFYQYYPVILDAKGAKMNPEDRNVRDGLVPSYEYKQPTSEYLKKFHVGGFYQPKK